MDRNITLAKKTPSRTKLITCRVTEQQLAEYQLLTEHLDIELAPLVRNYLDSLVSTHLGLNDDNLLIG
ncbi:hypothetical protein [Rivularia sp. UHCC 0363]|uniref:hypothetical protein n=1 Tax=Rivularia sp. UHCC 0363 TaxID=3110244 RepID=UPI002B21C71A|nr:hypothetical protein [Rivularia sp. UHCC 0363]MEA5596284.1 hypothetical protein [Rivularia sp. UHCC 0363]